MFKRILVKKNFLVLITIVSIASSLSIASYQYSSNTSNQIGRIASEDIAINAQNEAYDLSRIVVNRIDSVATNLQVIASAPSIQSGDIEGISQFFDGAQYSTEDLTEYYMWIDSGGTIKAASNIARANHQYNSLPVSEKPQFLTEPMETGSIYFSGVMKSPADNTERLYIAYPIVYSLQENERLMGDFRGVVAASIRLDTLGTILTSELSPTFQSDISLADISGMMVYSVEKSAIGKNIFEDPSYLTRPILSQLSGDTEAEIAEFLKYSNVQRQTGVKNVGIEGRAFTIAYHPIIHDGHHFWTLYIIAPHIFADSASTLLAGQDLFIAITFIAIGTVSVGMAYLLLSWNKRLEGTVKARTVELRDTNASLTESNSRLALANTRLSVHDRLQKEFIDVAAHELRTPIMPILGMTDLLESKFHLSKNNEIVLQKNDFEIISRNARRLERLASDILDVTKIETQSLHLSKEQFDLYDTIELAVNDIKNQFLNDRVRYIIESKKGTSIIADKSKIGQVLSNLLNNAAKFTDTGSITITAAVEKNGAFGRDTVCISISDTGTGIDPEILPRLFTKFTNKAGADRTQVGSGLGLYISKGIVEAHGGSVRAENNKEGRGCTITFDLPLISQEITTA